MGVKHYIYGIFESSSIKIGGPSKRKLRRAQKKVMDAQLIIAGLQENSEWWHQRRLNRLVETCMDLTMGIEEAITKS